MSIPIIISWFILTLPLSIAADYYAIPLIVKRHPTAKGPTIKFLIELAINIIVYGIVVLVFHVFA